MHQNLRTRAQEPLPRDLAIKDHQTLNPRTWRVSRAHITRQRRFEFRPEQPPNLDMPRNLNPKPRPCTPTSKKPEIPRGYPRSPDPTPDTSLSHPQKPEISARTLCPTRSSLTRVACTQKAPSLPAGSTPDSPARSEQLPPPPPLDAALGGGGGRDAPGAVEEGVEEGVVEEVVEGGVIPVEEE